jgi:DedD protein
VVQSPPLSAHTHDDGFHEIQLNGKQLVFLFMAATVVSVVIFLCGVLVGRGVRAERAPDTTASNTVADTIPQPAASPPAAPAAGSDPTTAAAPPPAVDELSYFDRLEKKRPEPEQLKPAQARSDAASPPPVPKAPAPPERTANTSRPAAAPVAALPPPIEPPKSAAPDAAPSAEPQGQGFAVQIAALNIRSEAEAIAKRLSSKGYAAYVLAPAGGTPTVFRVRVGKFPTRREAESVAARLQKEEQFKPWITR